MTRRDKVFVRAPAGARCKVKLCRSDRDVIVCRLCGGYACKHHQGSGVCGRCKLLNTRRI